jgi:hypothetical protein
LCWMNCTFYVIQDIKRQILEMGLALSGSLSKCLLLAHAWFVIGFCMQGS